MSIDVRELKQNEIVSKYLKLSPLHATIVSGTGTGKSFIALKLISKLKPDKVLILVNSTDLRDVNWKDEFVKFGLSEFYENNVIMQTYQYMYKQLEDPYKLTEKALVIMDEVDFIANTEKLANVINLYRAIRIVGLTGFITDSKLEWFSKYLPVIESYSANTAQADGLLNHIKFVFIKYDLSKNPKDRKIEYTKNGVKKHFYQSDNDAYVYAQNKFAKAVASKEMLKASFNRGEISHMEYLSKAKSVDYLIQFAVRDRANILLSSSSNVVVTKRLIEYIQSQDENAKIVVFSKRTAQSEKIVGKSLVYNGKSGKKGEKIMQSFKSSEINTLGVCDKINRGVNIPGLNYAIFESFYGSDTQATQRFGRMLRLKPDEIATIYILLPYYTTVNTSGEYITKATQQVTWALKMLRSTVVKYKEVWDYRILKPKNEND